MFTLKYESILEKIQLIDPIRYSYNRNYLNGAVTRLSPYISRGVISTRQIYEGLIDKGYEPVRIEKFIQELAWRDYWQQLWVVKRTGIDDDIKSPQPLVVNSEMPENILNHCTGITAIDKGIKELYATGYIHNHLRMYVASLVCNIAKCNWKLAAKWMYFHLLDGDWASNALSWQWVCGTNSKKLYYANQENINTYCNTSQKNTFLDIPYENIHTLEIPEVLKAVSTPFLTSNLPESDPTEFDQTLPSLIYNFYNLDPLWRNDLLSNKILLLEPSLFKKYPVSKKSIEFCIKLGKANIKDLKVFVGEFADLKARVNRKIYFKEHPINNYEGQEDPRSWLTSVKGEYNSFFSFWKKCKRELLN